MICLFFFKKKKGDQISNFTTGVQCRMTRQYLTFLLELVICYLELLERDMWFWHFNWRCSLFPFKILDDMTTIYLTMNG